MINRGEGIRGAVLLGLVLVLCITAAGLRRAGGEAGWPAFAAPSDCEVRGELLMEAMDSVGVADPQRAAAVWAGGLMNRSGALQYAVMTPTLRRDYAPQLTDSFPNWVTGVSSPWVSGYKVTGTRSPNQRTCVVELRFSTMTSAGPAGEYDATLTLVRQEDFWRVAAVDADPALRVYTGFSPEG